MKMQREELGKKRMKEKRKSETKRKGGEKTTTQKQKIREKMEVERRESGATQEKRQKISDGKKRNEQLSIGLCFTVLNLGLIVLHKTNGKLVKF